MWMASHGCPVGKGVPQVTWLSRVVISSQPHPRATGCFQPEDAVAELPWGIPQDPSLSPSFKDLERFTAAQVTEASEPHTVYALRKLSLLLTSLLSKQPPLSVFRFARSRSSAVQDAPDPGALNTTTDHMVHSSRIWTKVKSETSEEAAPAVGLPQAQPGKGSSQSLQSNS